MGRPAMCLVLVAVLLVVLPAAARGATVAADQACYRSGDEGTLTVTGFRTGSTVDAVVDGQPMVNLQPDGNGTASAPFTPLASPSRGEATETLTASDTSSSPVLSAQTTYRVTATAVTMSPSRAKHTAAVTWKLSGFLPGTAYLHVARRNAAGRTVTLRSLRLGVLAAPCGGLTVKTKQLPIARPVAGTTYVLRFSPFSSPTATAYVQRVVRVPRGRG